MPQATGNYRLHQELDASAVSPVSTRVSTDWTFRSKGPTGSGSVPLALLSVDYALPLDAGNHPTGGLATFTVRQARNVPQQKVQAFALWASLDDGTTWQPVPVNHTGDGGYTAPLPRPNSGRAVSLRVKADANAGSGIEQTIIRAYRAP